MRRIIAVNVILLGVVVGFFVFKYLQYRMFQQTPVTVSQPVVVHVEKGASWRQIAKKLRERGVIADERFFFYLVKEKKWDRKLKTGEYEFTGTLLPEEVARIITEGKVKLYAVTIPEGFNKYEMASLLSRLDWVADGASFVTYCDAPRILRELGIPEARTCEGLLFPSTYYFPRGVMVEDIITVMDRKMQEILARYRDAIKQSGLSSLHLLTLASIVEKESGAPDEQPRIAAVYLNRLKRGMKLQADPTVIYGLLPSFNGNLTRADLERDTPYNTYTREGLPPTPICFPGENAIRSVLEPAETDDLFFVATGEGRHYFSKTYEEHSAAVEHYQVKRLREPFRWGRR